jgi:NAD(P)-dependent dehydrogenase (short-subunit alcohol dehydrogenase family)
MDPIRLDGAVAVITGAAGGLGSASARAMAERGARVVLVDYNIDEATRVAASIGSDALALQADVSDPDSVAALFNAIRERHQTINVLHNNAGVFLGNGNGDGDMENMEFSVWQRTLAVNLSGPFLCTKYALPLLLPTGSGSIINTASVSGVFIGSTSVAYASSKAGLVGLTRAIVLSYASKGLRANAICPGTMDTEMSATVRNDPYLTERLIGTIPSGRIGQPAEFGQLAAFLASPASSYINGAIIPLEGGRTIY